MSSHRVKCPWCDRYIINLDEQRMDDGDTLDDVECVNCEMPIRVGCVIAMEYWAQRLDAEGKVIP